LAAAMTAREPYADEPQPMGSPGAILRFGIEEI
jgi:hypothetical protein